MWEYDLRQCYWMPDIDIISLILNDVWPVLTQLIGTPHWWRKTCRYVRSMNSLAWISSLDITFLQVDGKSTTTRETGWRTKQCYHAELHPLEDNAELQPCIFSRWLGGRCGCGVHWMKLDCNWDPAVHKAVYTIKASMTLEGPTVPIGGHS